MPAIHSISLDFSSWELHQQDDSMAVWTDSEGDVLAINYFAAQPDIPAPKNGPDDLRAYFRQLTSGAESGIVEVDTISLHGIDCGRLIVKARQEPTGFTYQGTCVVPRQGFSFVIRVQCQEVGTTGLREAAVMVMELSNPEMESVQLDDSVESMFPGAEPVGRIKGWCKDPYDSNYDESALYNLADDAKHDEKFPQHPLSRVRRKLQHVVESLEFDSSIIDAAEFLGPNEC